MTTRLAYFDSVLGRLGLPHGQAQTAMMLAWSAAESGTERCDGQSGAAYNPLNTTFDMAGASNFNSVGVKNYASLADGITATVDTLALAPYAGIRGVLARGGSLAEFGQAVETSPWGTGAAIFGGIQAVQGHLTEYASLPVGHAAPPPPGPHLAWRLEHDGKIVHQGPHLGHTLAILALHAHNHRHDQGWTIRLLRIEVVP